MLKIILMIVLLLLDVTNHFLYGDEKNDKSDLIIFSFDRPIQLQALIESIQKHMRGLNEIFVMYRVSDAFFDIAYAQLAVRFPHIAFYKQGNNPYVDFQPMLSAILFDLSKSDYILFGVDDIIVVDQVDLNICVQALREQHAYGFYLRMGKNITQCYSHNVMQDHPLPLLTEIKPGVFSWIFNQGDHDWKYPNTVDMTVYKKSEIAGVIRHIWFKNPNSFEGMWAARADYSKMGLCFDRSKIINIPMNMVQDTEANAHMGLLTPKQLLEMYNRGYKINIDALAGIYNKSPHWPIIPEFIPALHLDKMNG